MLYLALDENGYGPIMGPLVVTGIAATGDVERWPDEICDSKKLFSQNKSHDKIEKIALSIFLISKKKFPESPLEVFENFQNIDCKDGLFSICLKNLPEIPLWSTRDRITQYCEHFSEFCKKKGIKKLSVNSMILCVNNFNKLCKKGLKKDFVNYLLFEKIILSTKENCKNLFVMAGKIGGRKNYCEFLKNGFNKWEIVKKKESCDISSYILKKDSSSININFVKDIELQSFIGVLAGIYGKYVRQLIMTGINRSIGAEKYISGYRDNTTKSFLEKLKNTQINKDCLLRIK
ncbi:MAG: hypothetical protein NC906_00115 [Candidatus Omnitrophica bacterium]|nr:hypothetical protein [Candidatus Omnitrophota bacterium]